MSSLQRDVSIEIPVPSDADRFPFNHANLYMLKLVNNNIAAANNKI